MTGLKREVVIAVLRDIADNADHVNHAYLICGKCKAKKAIDEHDAIVRRKAAK